MNNIKFSVDSILNNQTENTAPKEIFQAVCDIIGEYYKPLGFRYSRSRPKITLKNSDFEIIVAFWSSGSNMAGSYVNLEIIGHAYSKTLAKQDKIDGNTFKGFLLSHADFWTKLNTSYPDGTIKTYLIDGQLANERTEDINYAIDRFNCNYNLYGVTEGKIEMIIQYINRFFINQIKGLVEKEKMLKFLSEVPPGTTLGRENSRFIKFIELQFDNDNDLVSIMKEKQIIK